MTKIQGWIVVVLLAFVAVNILVLDIVAFNVMSSFAEVSQIPEMPTDFPTDTESGPVPTSECDIDPTKC